MRFLFLLLLFLPWLLCAQPECKLIDWASMAYCKGDTAKAILHLEEFVRQHPEATLTDPVKIALGKLYLTSGDSGKAKAVLESILKTKEKESLSDFKEFINCRSNYDAAFPDRECGCRLVENDRLGGMKYKACLALHQVALADADYPQALKFLNLADTSFFRSSGCGNGDIMLHNQLSLLFENVYLRMGDTAQAIAHLLSVSLDEEGWIPREHAVCLIKSRYTQQQIAAELKRAPSSIEVKQRVVEGREFESVYVHLFGHEVQWWLWGGDRSKKALQEKLRRTRLFEALGR